MNRAATRHAHHIPLPTSMTTAIRPLPTQRNERDHNADLTKSSSDLFLTEGLDRIREGKLICPAGSLSRSEFLMSWSYADPASSSNRSTEPNSRRSSLFIVAPILGTTVP